MPPVVAAVIQRGASGKGNLGKELGSSGIASLPYEEAAFPAGLRLLSFVFQGALAYNKEYN